MKIKCPKCGFENEEGSDYCQSCGHNLNIQDTQAPPSTQSQQPTNLHQAVEKMDDVVFKPQKSKITIVKVIIGILVVLGLIFVILFVIGFIQGLTDKSSGSITSTSAPLSGDVSTLVGWQSFTSTEHGFTIMFPQYPTTQNVPESTTGSGLKYTATQYGANDSNSNTYIAQVADYDVSPPNFNNKSGLEAYMTGLVNSNNDQLTSSSYTSFLGYDAVVFTYKTSQGEYGKSLSFIKDDNSSIRLYAFIAFRLDDDFSDFDAFVSSFKLN